MRRLLSGLPLILAVVSLAVLGAATPSWAHSGLAPRLSDAAAVQKADAPVAMDGASRPTSLSAASQRPGIPWPVLLGGLAIAALGWRRPRRVLVFAVVLLLAVFAFEDGLHSVHHLVDRSQLNKCAVAVAAAHLNATAADDGATIDVVLPVIAALTEVSQTDPRYQLPQPRPGARASDASRLSPAVVNGAPPPRRPHLPGPSAQASDLQLERFARVILYRLVF
jgi:hypothetical protein